MKRILTLSQRQALLKWGCLALSVLLLGASFAAVPFIAGLVPKLGTGFNRKLFTGADAVGLATPAFALGNDFEEPSLDSVGEYEPEEPIPTPTPGEYDLPVSSSNLCWYEIGDDTELNIINRTRFDVKLDDYLNRDFPIDAELTSVSPLVLIIHTHGSESYLDNGYDFYSPDETFRSTDESKTVVHMGDILCEKLNSLGIMTIHDRTMYDTTDFNKSYNYSREGILKALSENPTIKFVIDLHRDSVFDSNDNNIKPLTNINGEDCAQLMLVVGTNQGGSNHPDWRDNLTFATHLQNEMNEMYPTLARPINLRSAAFNQALTKGSIILEAGACGNTIEEVERSITLFANSYAGLLKKSLK